MIGTTRSLKVWAYPAPADLRKGFDGLQGLVVSTLKRDSLSGDCFLFVNRRRTMSKVLLWDGTGLCIFQKRLERGRFACLWGEPEGVPVELTLSELTLFLEGSRLVGRVSISPRTLTFPPLHSSV